MLVSVCSSVNQPAVAAERITFAAVLCTFHILVVFAHPARLRCGESRMFLGDLASDLLHLRPFTQTESDTGLRRSFTDSGQPVEFAHIHASVTAGNANLPPTADAHLHFDVLFSCNQLRDRFVDFGEERNEPRPSRVRKCGCLRRLIFE